MLSVNNLQKSYGSFQAVRGVSFDAGRGETLGLLGPNGAGKTTTVSIVAGLLRADSGEVRVDGQKIESDTSPVKQKIGLVPQDLALFDEMSARRNLELFGALYGIAGAAASKEIDRVLTLTNLRDRANDRVDAFSGGMKRRLNLAAALLHDPQVLLLDEPTTGVDPQSRNAIFDNLEELRRAGKTLVYTTHYMEEAERLCDRIVIVDHGQAIANDTLNGLLKRLPASNVLQVEIGNDGVPSREEMSNWEGVRGVDVAEKRLRLVLDDLARVPALLQRLLDRGCVFEDVRTDRPTLEDVFLHLTGRSLRDA